jgi:hypothetical protein
MKYNLNRAEPRYTFSINLPISLYKKLLEEAGRGKLGTFIKVVLEKEFVKKEEVENQQKEQLKKQLITGYQNRAKNKKLQEELRIMEESSLEDVFTKLAKKENEQRK